VRDAPQKPRGDAREAGNADRDHPPRSVLASALVALLGDPVRRARLAKAARERCGQAFDWSAVADRYADLLLAAARTRV
jgi:glycosyltransferase involved in cell wall biosynthesis